MMTLHILAVENANPISPENYGRQALDIVGEAQGFPVRRSLFIGRYSRRGVMAKFLLHSLSGSQISGPDNL
jgi:hypothetical protein